MRLPQAIDALRMEPDMYLVHNETGLKIEYGNSRWLNLKLYHNTHSLPIEGWEVREGPISLKIGQGLGE